MLTAMGAPPLSVDLEFRGLVQQVSDDSLLARLDTEQLTVYGGFDPTADSLHVGHLQQLCLLRRMQLAGHRPIVLAGGGTGMIGDPGGRDTERPLLTMEQHEANMAGIVPQLERLLDFSPAAGSSVAVLVDNADWLCKLTVVEFLRDVGKHFTVNQMVAKESVKSRLERPDQGISYTEFSYMLLQAYDFLHLSDTYGCRLQIGGSDQWGNIVAGVDLVRRLRQEQAWALTSPLLLTAGGAKMGKTGDGAVWLDARRTSPYHLYQFLFRSDDAVVGDYLRRLTFLDHETILELDAKTAERPELRDAQRALAREVTTLVHGPDEAGRAERAAGALFTEEIVDLDEPTLLAVFADAPSSEHARETLVGGIELPEAFAGAGLVKSRSEARSIIEQGGAYVNNVRRSADEPLTRADLIHDRYIVLRKGKREHHLLVLR